MTIGYYKSLLQRSRSNERKEVFAQRKQFTKCMILFKDVYRECVVIVVCVCVHECACECVCECRCYCWRIIEARSRADDMWEVG